MRSFRSRASSGLRLAYFSPVCLLFLASIASAQAPQQTGVKDSVVVRAAEIEVLVLDSKGRPVTDLAREEFLLTVDGLPRKIDWVSPPNTSRGDASVEVAPAPASTGIPPLASALPHSTVFFLDEPHLDFRSRFRGLRALEMHLKTLPLQENVAVYSFRHGLKLVQPFTTDRAAIVSSLERLGRATPVSQQLNSTAQRASESEGVFQDLSRMLQGLAGRSEPKTLVLLAGYLPISSWELANPLGSKASFDFTEQVRQTSRDAFLARATILAVDPSGVPALDLGLTEPLALAAAARFLDDSRPGLSPSAAPVTSADPLASGGDALAVLARETGGSRLTLSNNPEWQLDAETQRLNSRYRIGFTPDTETLQTRQLAVRVTRPGLRVRTATGQLSLAGEALVRARFASSLLSGDLPLVDFPIRVEETTSPNSRLTKTLSVEVSFSSLDVFLQDRGDVLGGQVEILAATADKDGSLSDVRSQALDVRIPASAAALVPRSSFRTLVTLQVRGKGSLLVGVRDTTTNRLGEARLRYGE
jgi:VWFA-related protein